MASEGALPQEAERRRELRRMKAGATGLLLAAAAALPGAPREPVMPLKRFPY